MAADAAPESSPTPDPGGDPDSTASILEALLVDDADITWDPVTGKPQVVRRPKNGLDRPPGSA